MIDNWLPIIQISIIFFLMILSVMGIMYSKSKYRVRRNFTSMDKRAVRFNKQKNRCRKCKKALIWRNFQYHHKDGNRSNNRISNCQLLCKKCHSEITSNNHASYRNRTNWSSLKWSFASSILLLVIMILLARS